MENMYSLRKVATQVMTIAPACKAVGANTVTGITSYNYVQAFTYFQAVNLSYYSLNSSVEGQLLQLLLTIYHNVILLHTSK